MQFQAQEFAIFFPKSEYSWPRAECPVAIVDVFSALGPQDMPILALDQLTERRLRIVLRYRSDGTLDPERQRFQESIAADIRHPRAERLPGILGHDLDFLLCQDIARIHTFVHQHKRDAGFLSAGKQRVLDRGCPAPFRQERSMHIDAPETRQREKLWRQDFAVSGHDDDIRFPAFYFLYGCLIQPYGLLDREIVFDGLLFDSARHRFLVAAGRLIRLGNDADDSILFFYEARQDNGGQFRRPHKDRAHFGRVSRQGVLGRSDRRVLRRRLLGEHLLREIKQGGHIFYSTAYVSVSAASGSGSR